MKWKVLSKKNNKGNLKNEEIIEELLGNRGITEPNDIKNFFNLRDSIKLSLTEFGISKSEIKKAIIRIKKAKKDKEEIIVFGDYDADGICSTAIMWETLHSIGITVMPYIPERTGEGYGLNTETIDKLKHQYSKLKLIITVDNGIVAHEAIGYIKSLGIDVIVTDHHLPDKKKLKADALIHSTLISGSGVAWVLARELYKEFKMNLEEIKQKLELATIGTVADQIPLLGVNRNIVKEGILQLRRTKRQGLIALSEISAFDLSTISVYGINFVIAPKINAMGRLKHGLESLRLLCTKNKERAKLLAIELNQTNDMRKKEVLESYQHALELVSKSNNRLIIVWHESYHEGVIGLIASKLVEQYYRPAIVMSVGKTVVKASARSIEGFNIIESIRVFNKYLIAGGGHPMAAGFSLKLKHLEKFNKELTTYAQDKIGDDLLDKTLKIDMNLEFNQINWELIKALQAFEPSGIGNPTPKFLLHKIKVINSRLVGKEGAHIKLTVQHNGREYDAIGFGLAEKYKKLVKQEYHDICFNLEKNMWQGVESIQLKLIDIQ